MAIKNPNPTHSFLGLFRRWAPQSLSTPPRVHQPIGHSFRPASATWPIAPLSLSLSPHFSENLPRKKVI